MATLSSKTGLPSFSQSITEINYFTDGGFERGANGVIPTGWAQYQDAAAAVPVDGTGGTAVPTVTMLCSNSSPIRGTMSAIITKDAVNRQGVGFSFLFDISPADRGVTSGVSFEMDTDTNYVSGDVVFYIYDVTNSLLITPRSVSLPKLDNYGKFFSDFGLTSGTQYRFILHIATANALAWTLKLDTMVNTTTKAAVPGAAISEWQSYTPTVTGMTDNTGTIAGFYRRVGSNAEIKIDFVKSGTAGSGVATGLFSIPTGLTVNTAVLGTVGTPIVGSSGTYSVEALSAFNESQVAVSGNLLGIINTGAGSFYQGADFRAASQVNMLVSVPIAEWSGNGTVNLGPGAQVEYAATSGTWDADSTTTVYGPSGFAIGGTLSGSRAKTVTWQYPLQSGDLIQVEFSKDQITWIPAQSAQIGPSNTSIVSSLDSTGAAIAGIYTRPSSATQTIVIFAQYANMANDDLPITNWPSTNAFWRVRKANPSSPVGFGLATQTASGLVSNQTVVVNLTSSELTSQTNCLIEPADVVICKWSMTNGLVTFTFRFDFISLTVGGPSATFVLPSTVPRPVANTFGTATLYDNVGTSVGAEVFFTTTGVFDFRRVGGANFTGGANNSFLRGSLSWFTT